MYRHTFIQIHTYTDEYVHIYANIHTNVHAYANTTQIHIDIHMH